MSAIIRILKNPALWIVLVLAVGGYFGLGYLNREAEAKKAAETAKATRTEEQSPYTAVAQGKADVEGGVIPVAARRAGVVREVYVQEGDRVTKGQALARQEDEDARLALASAEAALAQARAQIPVMQVKLAAAQREYQRLARLAPESFVARQKLDQMQDEIRDWTAQIAAQETAVRVAEAQRNQAAYTVELTVVRAPVDGRIVRRYANPGSGASTLNVSTLFDLEPDAQRIVRAEIAESAIPKVAIGQEVEVTPEGDSSQVTPGRVLRRAPVFGARKLQSDDPSERSDERVVEVVVATEGAPFLIGQRVLVKFLKPGFHPGAGARQAARIEAAAATAP